MWLFLSVSLVVFLFYSDGLLIKRFIVCDLVIGYLLLVNGIGRVESFDSCF